MQLQLSTKKTLLSTVLAAGALTMLAPMAHAAVIVYSGPPIPVTNSIDGLYLNVITGASGTVAPSGWDINVYNNTAGLTFFTNSTSSAYVGSPVSALGLGSTIGASSTFSGSGQISGVNFQAASSSTYFGFRFTNEATGLTHYGWAQLSTGATAGFPASLLSYAYESTAGASITISAVPEPATYGLMGLGLAAVVGLSRAQRRKSA